MLTSSRRPVCCCGRLTHIRPSQQTRNATLIKRPKRPYTFTQLITLSDGSTFLHRTTSPAPVYTSTKDTKNTPLWNPSSQKLLNVEEDEAGRLKKFRGRFGRGWDAEISREDGTEDATEGEDESLLDLMTASATEAGKKGEAAGVREEKTRSGKGKGGQK